MRLTAGQLMQRSLRYALHAGTAELPSYGSPRLSRALGCVLAIALVTAVPVQAQQHRIRGTVTSADAGTPLPGVRVIVEGTSIGAVTDAGGRYVLIAPSGSGTLRFSGIGFGQRTIDIAGQSVIDVQLVRIAVALEGVVVVGYGTQLKKNLTGAVDQITSAQLENRPITSLAQGLQGASPNLNVVFGSGQPGQKAEYNIRGITSINGGSPLILIDGVPGDPDLINPQDVESVSVLKDAASAAIYGARGAFGVILITTKQGTQRTPQVTYSSNVATRTQTIVPEAVTDPYISMLLYNEAYKGYAGKDWFTQEDMDYALQRSQDPSLPAVVVRKTSGGDRYQYFGTTDWLKELYRDRHPMTQHNLSVSGRKEDLRYYVSGGYLDEAGVFSYNSDTFQKYNFRAKLDLDVTHWLSFRNNLSYNEGKYEFPTLWGNSVDIWRYLAVVGQSLIPPQNPDGTWTSTGSFLGFYRDGGRGLNRERTLQNTVGGEVSLLGGRWRISGDYTYQSDGYNRDEHFLRVPFSSAPGTISQRGVDRVVETNADNYHHILNLYANYAQKAGRHDIRGLLGVNQELRTFSGFVARGDDVVGGLGSLSLAVGNQFSDSWASEWAVRGAFSRLNYSYDDRYLLEFNGRYDGTSRFRRGDRFGFFPSASAAWRVSQEGFFRPLRPAVNELKLRMSYGSLGNQSVGTYAYIPTMPTVVSPVIVNGTRPVTVGPPGLVSPSLTWERATTLDIGTDASFLGERLDFVFDWYRRNTTDMLTKGRTLPAVLGANEPDENAADLKTTGWEVSLKWADKAGRLLGKPFTYGLGLVLSDYQTVITRFDNPNDYLGDFYVGMKWGEIWGYETEGFFQSQEEIASHANQNAVERFPERRSPGDLKFRDRNGDGVISPGDNTLNDPGDRFIIGNTTPRYSYGFKGNFDWNNVAVSAFLQGVGKRDYYPQREVAYFWSVYNRPYNTAFKHLVGNYWTPENRDAYFPRPKAYIALVNGRDLAAPQTRYLQDASYLRLKNLTVKYTLPRRIVSAGGFERTQIYFSGENLWERTRLRIPVDPELLLRPHSWGDGQKYPFQRSYSLGVNLTF